MNALLIHNDNIKNSLINHFSKEGLLHFSISSAAMMKETFSFDSVAHGILKNHFASKGKYDVIFIPYTLSNENYLELTGIIVAAHIRLSPEFKNTKTPIVFLGSESKGQIAKLSDLGGILFTSGVFSTDKQDIDSINNQYDWILKNKKELNDIEYSNFLEKLDIKPSANHLSYHSIANEWAIYRWASAINANDSDIEKIITNVETQLYFKYLRTLYPKKDIPELHENQLKIKYSESPKILYIDDEADKGWYEIFCSILYDINNLNFSYLDEELQSKTRDEIIKLSTDKIKAEEIDLVILDFRLHPDDFNTSNIQEVTGLKLLKEIKNVNPGIQVVIFSATNKVWNLQALQEAGADGFIIKESAENSEDIDFTKDSILAMTGSLELCINKVFLKEIFTNLSPLSDFVKLLNSTKPKNYSKKGYFIPKGNIPKYCELIKSCEILLLSNLTNLNLPFLQLILIIEDIVKTFYIHGSDGNHYVEISLFERIPVLIKQDGIITLKIKPKPNWSSFELSDFDILKGDKDYKYFDTIADRVMFNYRLFSVLYFKYNIALSDINKYSRLYQKRSRAVAHLNSSDDKIITRDIIDAVELIAILFKNNNKHQK